MNSGKLPSSKELTVVPITGRNPSTTILSRISMKVQGLFGGLRSHSAVSPGVSTPSNMLNIITNRGVSHVGNNPMEDMMSQILFNVSQLPDESIITLARGLDRVFGIGVERDRKTKTNYINYVIMPLYSEAEELPTMFFDKTDTIIVKFGITIKERLNIIRQQKLAVLLGNISRGIDNLPLDKSMLKLAKELHELFGIRKPGTVPKEADYINWDNKFKVEYINEQLLLRIGVNEQLPEILEKDADIIINGFYRTVQQKASLILNNGSSKSLPRLGQSK